MASILDRFGIKEVADVTFYELDSNGIPTNPVLFLDTLKVSTIEQTAETTDATGGKGNAPLISWDYNKEINVTLEDALFSPKSMAIMFGNGTVKSYTGDAALIMKTEQFTATATAALPEAGISSSGWAHQYTGPDGKLYTKINPKFYRADGANATSLVSGEKYLCSFDIKVSGHIIEVSADTFPGTYYITGDTYARSDASGKDEFFQFIIPKAKLQSENTLTLEAEGDPTVFNMNLKVLRPADGQMMKLVQYNAIDPADASDSGSTSLIHNHALREANSAVIELSKTVAVGGSIDVDVTDAAASKSSSADTTIATATAVANKVTIQGVAVGQTVIEVQNSSSSIIAHINVTVIPAVG